tara:strand:+ start:644 stop:976 length:333 start_codon:yes stop_codon:yes gene_type:complete
MDLKPKFIKVHNTDKQGYIYTFESDFVLELMRLDLEKSIILVLQIEKYLDDNYLFSPDDEFELAGVIKLKDPYYFVMEVVHLEHIMFCSLTAIDSDSYLDYYNKNLVLIK